MSYYYAQLDQNGICVAVSQLHSEAQESHLIPVDGLKDQYLGQKWDAPSSSWLEAPHEPHVSPDYYAFWDALLVSSVYQSIRAQALTIPAVLVASTEFIAAITDAKAGRPNQAAIQACIYYLLAAATFTEAELAELGALLAAGGLDAIYTLELPQ